VVAHTYIALPPIVDIWFQILFHSPPGVLFTFPSRYLFTIGHQVVFSLTRWSGQIHTGLHVSHVTRDYNYCFNFLFAYGTVTLFGCPFQNNSTKIIKHNFEVCILQTLIISQPPYYNAHRLLHNIGLGSSPFAHHYKGNHFVFFSLRYLDVSVHAVRLATIYIHVAIPRVYPRQVAPFGNLRIKA
jgi:hypothetical protein